MIKQVISTLWSLLMLPIKLILLPYKIVSTILSLVFYALILAIAGGLIYFLFL